ncbi:hypothetical protein GOBAR_AA05139 [Gossypium barbadense]|uniref:Uncharacterized protein n=1 Tax=Gossypium barbadense TaxID=3634 RepID=A0A2P5YIL2_GOSBA|nr:hypothetical protein GOBAR_AA05139 [Gossypium barbadense]
MGYDKSPWPCDMAVGKFDTYMGVGMETNGRARDKARSCFFDTGVRHARAIQPWTTIHERGTFTWVGEKQTQLGTAVQDGRVPHTPKKNGLNLIRTRAWP